jgi:hypothetical protein
MVKNYRPASAGVLSALPGTYLVTAYFDDGQVELVKFNVIGWSISSGRSVIPVVLDPRLTDEDPWHVIHPDGRVECSDGQAWEDVDAWVRQERRHRRMVSEGLIPKEVLTDESEVVEVFRPAVPQGMPDPPQAEQSRVSAFQPSAAYAAQVL